MTRSLRTVLAAGVPLAAGAAFVLASSGLVGGNEEEVVLEPLVLALQDPGMRGATIEHALSQPGLAGALLARLEAGAIEAGERRPLGWLVRAVLEVWPALAEPGIARRAWIARALAAASRDPSAAAVLAFAWRGQRLLGEDADLAAAARPGGPGRTLPPGPRTDLFLALEEDRLLASLDAGRLGPLRAALHDPAQPLRVLAWRLAYARLTGAQRQEIGSRPRPEDRPALALEVARGLPPARAVPLLVAWAREEEGEALLPAWCILAARDRERVGSALLEQSDLAETPQPSDQDPAGRALRGSMLAAYWLDMERTHSGSPEVLEELARHDPDPVVRARAWSALARSSLPAVRLRAQVLMADPLFRDLVAALPERARSRGGDLWLGLEALGSGGDGGPFKPRPGAPAGVSIPSRPAHR